VDFSLAGDDCLMQLAASPNPSLTQERRESETTRGWSESRGLGRVWERSETCSQMIRIEQLTFQCLFVSIPLIETVGVKGGVKLDRWGGGKLDQMSV